MRSGQRVFVDTGGWLALALAADPYHERAAEAWTSLQRSGARPCTSVPVVIETFTYLQRKIDARLAHSWSEGLRGRGPELFACGPEDLAQAWQWLQRRELHKLSLVDATSFVLLKKHQVRNVLAFDTHFAQAGFRLVV
ncbi:MAG TPA: PIN domain-containing protein [Myxococcales bacterium]|nr:PIN domain-containing protein [Myxococcales bacterium]